MDQKHWHWGKKSREKTILETDKANLTSKENEEVCNLNDSKCNYMLEIWFFPHIFVFSLI